MQFIEGKSKKAGETIFANYLPLDTVKEILKSNNFYTPEEIAKFQDSDERRLKKKQEQGELWLIS